jgi:hypothetical protein
MRWLISSGSGEHPTKLLGDILNYMNIYTVYDVSDDTVSNADYTVSNDTMVNE